MNTLDKILSLDIFSNFDEVMELIEKLNLENIDYSSNDIHQKLSRIYGEKVLKAFTMLSMIPSSNSELKQRCKNAGLKISSILDNFKLTE